MPRLLFIAIGGALGALLRYGTSGLIHRYIDSSFPWGTLGVNLLGAFFIGFLWGLFEETAFSSNVRSFIFIGVIASFTTFSTYSLETLNLFRDGEIKLAISNIFLSNVLGIVFVFAGLIASKYFITVLGRR